MASCSGTCAAEENLAESVDGEDCNVVGIAVVCEKHSGLLTKNIKIWAVAGGGGGRQTIDLPREAYLRKDTKEKRERERERDGGGCGRGE